MSASIPTYHHRVRLLKALAHPARLRLLLALREMDACVCHLTTLLGARQPYVSQQLGYLREVGLVKTYKVGLNVFYHVTEPRIFQFLDGLSELNQREKNSRRETPTVLSNCPCPTCQAVPDLQARRRQNLLKESYGVPSHRR